MTNLPEIVDEDEVKAMFGCADKDGNGKINYGEFILMCNLPKQESIPTKLPDPNSSDGETKTSKRYKTFLLKLTKYLATLYLVLHNQRLLLSSIYSALFLRIHLLK
jgi:hypothetical protein